MQTAAFTASQSFTGDTAIIADLMWTIESQKQEIRILREKIDYLTRKRFAPSSERSNDLQGDLFPDLLDFPTAEEPEEPEAPEEEVAASVRKRGGRRRPPADLPRIRIVHDLDEADKHCACGTELKPMGEEVSEQYDIEPAKVRVLQHVRIKYACPCCDHGIKTAPAPAAALPRTQASPGFLAYLGTSKFVDGLPLHRQAQIMTNRFGVPFTSTTLATWVIKAHERLLKPIVACMKQHQMLSHYLQADETRIKVLDEPGRGAWQDSWLWGRAAMTGPPIILFDYRASRAGAVATELLTDFSGYLQTDGYGGYNGTAAREDVTQLGCWAHARRKFKDAAKSAETPEHKALAKKAVAFISRLYAIERTLKDCAPEEREVQRELQSRPLLMQFRAWRDETLQQVKSPDSMLGKAYTYLTNQWPKLLVYLEDGLLHIDNNNIERFNRPIAQGRKQWLFAQSEAGGHATAAWYSVVSTAKANGWEPYHYLKELFTRLPQYLQDGRPVDDLMPWVMPKPEAA